MDNDLKYMKRCLYLARLGEGNVAPNPLVGAVIVHDDKIIGEGFHEKHGSPHAEINAINAVKDKSLLKTSTIYVNLEPCSHFGKTPPCANTLVTHQFKRVVIGALDPHSKVNGKGLKILQEQGISTTTGVLEKECIKLNKRFYTFHQKKRPYIVLKWAQTKNRKIDAGLHNEKVTPISSPETKAFVHRLRIQNQAILVGKNTVKHDNPQLTVRTLEGPNPIKITMDSELELSNHHSIFNDPEKVIVFNLIKEAKENNIHYIRVQEMDIPEILKRLYQENISSVLVEGGRKTIESFIKLNLWDETFVLTSKTEFKKGTNAPTLNTKPVDVKYFFGDKIELYKNKTL